MISSAPRKQSLAKNVYQQYTLGMQQLTHAKTAQLIRTSQKLQKSS